MSAIIIVFVFFFGAIIGSFLNVVILRYRSGRSLGGRSGCFTCGKQLGWTELIPIGSFLTQRGRCAGCRAPISWQYPIVEALTGFIFVALYLRFSYILLGNPLLFGILFLYYGYISSVLVVLSVYDLRHKILPDQLTFLFAAVAFIGMFFIQGDSIILHVPTLWHFLAAILLPAPFSFLWLVSKGKWMGLGDAKLMIGIGFLLGLSAGVAAIMLAFWIGAAFSVLYLVAARLARMGKRLTLNTAIPFGPFLALGTLVVIFANIDFSSIMAFFR